MMKISGIKGKYHLINGIYEPMAQPHNQRPAWQSKGMQNPVYLFHSGNNRWVLSKQLSDGARCYAYVNDDGDDPSATGDKYPWHTCDERNAWSIDKRVKCTAISPPDPAFNAVKAKVDKFLTEAGIQENKPEILRTLFKRLDTSGDGQASMDEVVILCKDMSKTGSWPKFVDDASIIKMAFHKTTKVDGTDGDDFVSPEEFHGLILNLFWFGYLNKVFDEFDADDDQKVNLKEFKDGLKNLKVAMSDKQMEQEFKTIDHDHGGSLDYAEFCSWIRNKAAPATADISGSTETPNIDILAAAGANGAHFVNKKALQDFAALEEKVTTDCKDVNKLQRMWKTLDFNGNGSVSLAEIDKFAVQAYPLLNNKPALMRAYHATLKADPNSKEAFVHKKEFKALLVNLFYFNKLFWLFEEGDSSEKYKDRRMNLAEFKSMMGLCGVNWKPAKLEEEFNKMDENGGGIVLFDEFCRYFTDHRAPDAMTEFVHPSDEQP